MCFNVGNCSNLAFSIDPRKLTFGYTRCFLCEYICQSEFVYWIWSLPYYHLTSGFRVASERVTFLWNVNWAVYTRANQYQGVNPRRQISMTTFKQAPEDNLQLHKRFSPCPNFPCFAVHFATYWSFEFLYWSQCYFFTRTPIRWEWTRSLHCAPRGALWSNSSDDSVLIWVHHVHPGLHHEH